MNSSRLWLTIVGCAFVGLACGCSKKISSIDAPHVPLFSRPGTTLEQVSDASNSFPLAIGNRWEYRFRFAVEGGDAGAPYVYESDLTDELTCVTSHDGRDYFASRETSSDPRVAPLWVQYRQDRDGLYEWEFTGDPGCGAPPPPPKVAAGAPPTWPAVAARLKAPENSAAWLAAWNRVESRCRAVATMARGGASAAEVAPGEIQRLAYPLHPGQAWDIRQDPHFWSWVEGRTVLETPAGRFTCWAVGVGSELFAPEDRLVMWFGREGSLGYLFRFHDVVTDENGNPIGVLAGVQSQTLTGVHLVGR